MRIAYCSMLLPEEKHLTDYTKERLVGISVHKVQMASIEGIDSNIEGYVDIYNIINTINFPKFRKLFFESEKWKHTPNKTHYDYHIGYINLFGIKYIVQTFNMYRMLKKWVKEDINARNLICVHHTFLPSMVAAVLIKRKYRNKVKICFYTGDLPGVYGAKQGNGIKDVLIRQLVNKNNMRLAQMFDSYVFVTSEMANAVVVANKPVTIVECTYTRPPYYVDRQSNNGSRTVFYAGAIRDDYGIPHLLNAFSLIDNPDYRLVIAGGGPAENEVREYVKKDSRATFLGYISAEEVAKEQANARVIVSPRQSFHDYVKYSFPSKSLDSMASGIPYVAHRLPCDPPEYESYINYAGDDSDIALRDKIVEIAELPDEIWRRLGDDAKQFVLRDKSPEIMMKSVVEMWNQLWK